MTTAYQIMWTRGDVYTTSFDVYGRAGGYPVEAGDGIFMGNTPILPWQSGVTGTYVVPAAGNWFFIAIPLAQDRSGPLGRAT